MRRIVYVILGLFIAAVILLATLASTESGLQWMFSRLKDFLPGRLSVEHISGRLIGPITLKGISYHSTEMTASVDALHLDWQPSRLLILHVQISDLNASGIRIELEESTGPHVEKKGLPVISLPLDTTVDSLLLQDISVLQAGGASPLIVKELLFKGTMDKESLRIETFRLLTPDMDLALNGTIRPSGSYPLDIQSEWTFRTKGYSDITGNGRFSGTLVLLDIQQTVTAPFSAVVQASVSDVAEDLRWEADISLSDLILHTLREDWPGTRIWARAYSSGTAASFDIEGTIDLADNAYGKVAGAYAIGKEDNAWLVKNLRLSVPGTKSELDLSGRFARDNGVMSLQAAGKWTSLSWPFLAEAPSYLSREGTFAISGSLDDYVFSLNAALAGKDVPPMDMKLRGTGTQKGLTISSLSAKLLEGEVEGTAAVSWDPGLDWQATIDGSSLNPGDFWPDWKGRLNISTDAAGSVKEGANRVSVKKAAVQGQLRGHPFRAEGVFHMTGSTYSLPVFELQSGSAHLSASGFCAEECEAEWKMNIPALGDLLPGGKGDIYGQGRFSGKPRLPKFTAHLNSKTLSYDDYQWSNLNISMDVDTGDNEDSRVEISAGDILLDTTIIPGFTLKGEGRIASHTLTLSVKGKEESVLLSASGGYQNEAYNGTITRSDLDLADFGVWKLRGHVPFSLSAKGARTGELCWVSNVSSACFQTDWTEDKGLKGNARLSEIQLSLFRTLMPDGTALDGTLEGTADLSYGREALTGSIAITLPQGLFSYTPEKKIPSVISFEQVRINSMLTDEALALNAEASLQERGSLHAFLSLPGFTPRKTDNQEQSVSGRLIVDLDVLDLLPLFTSAVEDTKGRITSDLAVAGTLADPAVTGELKLQEGRAGIAAAGITLKDLQINIDAQEPGAVNLNGRFVSGEGEARIAGNVDFKNRDNIRSEFSIKGERVEAVRLPEALIIASPDIRGQVENRSLDIEGTLDIPEALIEPHDLSGAVPVSKDVHIITESEQVKTEEQWQVSSRLRLTLGEKVRFKGFGLTGRITGDVRLADEPRKATKAQGELQIRDGRYKAYGQDLSIESGRLIFVGLLDDPGLDIRAVRTIKDISAGVRVQGTLQSPELIVFSVPAMDQADALSYVLFGRPMNGISSTEGNSLYNAALSAGLSGGGLLAGKIGAAFGIEEVEIDKGDSPEQASLFIGKYLSPKLYVSYGIGLFEPISTLRLRYQLAPRWLLQTEYGIESGGDILYKIER